MVSHFYGTSDVMGVLSDSDKRDNSGGFVSQENTSDESLHLASIGQRGHNFGESTKILTTSFQVVDLQ